MVECNRSVFAAITQEPPKAVSLDQTYVRAVTRAKVPRGHLGEEPVLFDDPEGPPVCEPLDRVAMVPAARQESVEHHWEG